MKKNKKNTANVATHNTIPTVNNSIVPLRYKKCKIPKNLTKKELKNIVHSSGKLNKIEYLERLVQHKLKKWEKKHPCPINIEQNPKDIFYDHFFNEWNDSKQKATEHIRNVVISMYFKLEIVYLTYTKKYIPSRCAYLDVPVWKKTGISIKDKTGKGINLKHPYLKEDDTLYTNAQKIAINIKTKDPSKKYLGIQSYDKKFVRCFYNI